MLISSITRSKKLAYSLRVRLVGEVEKLEDRKWWESGKVKG